MAQGSVDQKTRKARRYRQRGLSFREIAKRLDVSLRTIQRWTTVKVPAQLLRWAEEKGRKLRIVEPGESSGPVLQILSTSGPRLILNEPDPSWSLPPASRKKIIELLRISADHELLDALEQQLAYYRPMERRQLRSWARCDRDILVGCLAQTLERFDRLSDEEMAEVVAVCLDARGIPRPGFECGEKETSSRSRLVRFIQKTRPSDDEVRDLVPFQQEQCKHVQLMAGREYCCQHDAERNGFCERHSSRHVELV